MRRTHPRAADPLATAAAIVWSRIKESPLYRALAAQVIERAVEIYVPLDVEGFKAAGGRTAILLRTLEHVLAEHPEATAPAGSVLMPTTVADVLRAEVPYLRQEAIWREGRLRVAAQIR